MNPPSPWKVVLIVEDDSDGQACRILTDKLDFNLALDWLPANGVGNIKRRCDQLIELARDRIQDGRGCVAVLLDRDGKDVRRAEPHRTIRRLCHQAGVPLLLATESLEAWLLADAGCANWLEVKRPANADSLPHPKQEVARAYYRKTRRPYTRRARRILADHANGSALLCSPSLQSTLAHLDNSPCAAAVQQ